MKNFSFAEALTNLNADALLQDLLAFGGEQPACLKEAQCFLLAGGAAHAAILAELQKQGLLPLEMSAPINDIDIFIPATGQQIEAAKKRKSKVSTLTVMEKEESVDSYRNVFTTDVTRYSVVTTDREGLFNLVYAKAGHWNNRFCENTNDAMQVLQNFDLNCTQVGIYANQKEKQCKLIFTPAYAKFLRTRQLEVEDVHTPFHTAIRFFTKLQELPGIYGNVPATMQLLCTRIAEANASREFLEAQTGFVTNHQYANIRRLRAKSYAGFAYALKVEKVRKQMSEYFHIPIGVLCIPNDIFTLTPKTDVNVRMQQEMQRDYLQEVMDRARRGSQFGFRLQPEHLLVPNKQFVAWHRADTGYYGKIACAQIKKALENADRAEALAIELEGAGYLEQQVSSKDLDSLNKLLREHKALKYMFVPYSFEQKVNLSKAIARSVAVHGKRCIGILESGGFADIAFLQEKLHNLAEEYETFETFLLDYFKREIEKLGKNSLVRTYLPKGFMLDGYEVIELVNALELLDEGTRQKHCVGGYATAVARKQVQIYSLRKYKEDGSINPHETITVSLNCRELPRVPMTIVGDKPQRKDNPNGKLYMRLFLQQEYGLQNRHTTDEETNVVAKLELLMQFMCADEIPDAVTTKLLSLRKFAQDYEEFKTFLRDSLNKGIKKLRKNSFLRPHLPKRTAPNDCEEGQWDIFWRALRCWRDLRNSVLNGNLLYSSVLNNNLIRAEKAWNRLIGKKETTRNAVNSQYVFEDDFPF